MKELRMMSSDMGWWDNAPCKGVPTAVFFPEIGKGRQFGDPYAEALAVCGGCHFRERCLRFALEAEVHDIRRYGVFGGMTPRDRERYVCGG
jgi:hypothetical protein